MLTDGPGSFCTVKEVPVYLESKIKSELFNLTSHSLSEIEKNLTENISVEDITQKFEKSHWQFQRMFRSIAGISMGQYVRERRLSEAAQRLRKTEQRILDIALEFNFNSQEAFSRSFKSFFGFTPGDYRTNLNIALREFRNPITVEKLHFFWENVQRVPEIIEREEALLVGSIIEFKSHFVEGSDCQTKVVAHWAQFSQRKNTIPHRSNQETTGVVMSSELDLREEKLTYFSSVEVTEVNDIPEGLQEMTIPGGLYACFENRGCAQTTGSLMDFVYGIWLDSSGYTRRKGFDLEIFDYRYKQGDPNSISRFLIPVKAVIK